MYSISCRKTSGSNSSTISVWWWWSDWGCKNEQRFHLYIYLTLSQLRERQGSDGSVRAYQLRGHEANMYIYRSDINIRAGHHDEGRLRVDVSDYCKCDWITNDAGWLKQGQGGGVLMEGYLIIRSIDWLLPVLRVSHTSWIVDKLEANLWE